MLKKNAKMEYYRLLFNTFLDTLFLILFTSGIISSIDEDDLL